MSPDLEAPVKWSSPCIIEVNPNSKVVAEPIALEQSNSPALNLSDWYEPPLVGIDKFNELDDESAYDVFASKINKIINSVLIYFILEQIIDDTNVSWLPPLNILEVVQMYFVLLTSTKRM